MASCCQTTVSFAILAMAFCACSPLAAQHLEPLPSSIHLDRSQAESRPEPAEEMPSVSLADKLAGLMRQVSPKKLLRNWGEAPRNFDSTLAGPDPETGNSTPPITPSADYSPGGKKTSETTVPRSILTSSANPSPTSRVIPRKAAPVVAPSPPKILFQPALPDYDALGRTILRPVVRLAETPDTEIFPTPAVPLSASRLQGGAADALTMPHFLEPELLHQNFLPPVLGQQGGSGRFRRIERWWNRMAARLERQQSHDLGIGHDRLPFALFEMDASQPLNNFRLRFDSAYDWEFPDRAEYFWSKIGGKGPNPKKFPGDKFPGDPTKDVDYQDVRFLMETGGERFSAATEIPLRFLSPSELPSTGGMGDLVLTTKTVMIDGQTWQLTQVFRTQMNTGSSTTGRGNGHVSMEPGLVARYKWSRNTFLHSELKFWFPVGADPDFSGHVLRYGLGFGHLLYDSDTFAVIPTLEFVGWTALTGKKTTHLGDNGELESQRFNGEYIFNVYPGVRLAHDNGGDFGLFEVGLTGGLSVTERHWYRALLRLDFRWSY